MARVPEVPIEALAEDLRPIYAAFCGSYGNFANAVLAFLILAFALFLVVKWINKLRRPDAPPAPNTKPCAYCKSPIHLEATRCPQCTSDLAAVRA